MFHQLTHLHLLANTMTWLMIPMGFSGLRNLTHLLMHWATMRACAPILPAYLYHASTVVMILWEDGTHHDASIQGSLKRRGLVD